MTSQHDQQNSLASISSHEHAFQLSFTYKISLLCCNIIQNSAMVTAKLFGIRLLLSFICTPFESKF